ncbi:MAG: type II toxin-antitoxin system PemK/MazF family toxin [Flammeovirgaceae bacterium]|nr:MAG: type II toxin-antitoxin system PemK/MazF family toxin [Flammeovirgaceae bacterium]
MVRAYSVYLVNLDPTVGFEIQKSRPCVVLSPDEMNAVLGTVIIAPMTSTIRGYPSRVEVRFQNKTGEVCLDQLRAVDESRLSKQPLGRLKQSEIDEIMDVIADIFKL